MISNNKSRNRFIEGYKIKKIIITPAEMSNFLTQFDDKIITLDVDSARKVVAEVENLNDVQRFEYFEEKMQKNGRPSLTTEIEKYIVLKSPNGIYNSVLYHVTLYHKCILLFDFDMTLIDKHSGGYPVKRNLTLSPDNIYTINTNFNDYQYLGCEIIILSRCVFSELNTFFNNMYKNKTFTFKKVEIIAPTEAEFIFSDDTLYWAKWKANKGMRVYYDNPNSHILFIDDTLANVEAMHIAYNRKQSETPNDITKHSIRSVGITPGNYYETFDQANNFVLLPTKLKVMKRKATNNLNNKISIKNIENNELNSIQARRKIVRPRLIRTRVPAHSIGIGPNNQYNQSHGGRYSHKNRHFRKSNKKSKHSKQYSKSRKQRKQHKQHKQRK